MSDIGDWFRSIPAITRYWFAASVAVPLVGKLGLISPAYLFLWPEAFLYRFQVWRPITATFYFPVGPGTGFLYLVNLYFLYQYSSRLETGAFDGRPADYLFMLLFNWICIVVSFSWGRSKPGCFGFAETMFCNAFKWQHLPLCQGQFTGKHEWAFPDVLEWSVPSLLSQGLCGACPHWVGFVAAPPLALHS